MEMVNRMKRDVTTKTEFYVVGLGEANMDALKKIASSKKEEHLIKAKGCLEREVAAAFLSNSNGGSSLFDVCLYTSHTKPVLTTFFRMGSNCVRT